MTLNRGRIIKQDILSLPFEEITDINTASEFVKKYGIVKSWSWLGPQLLARLGNYKLPEKDENGKYDGVEFLKLNVSASTKDQGIWWLITKLNTSDIMGKQTDPDHLQVCSLVPLYMAAMKKFKNVEYKSWTNIRPLVRAKLYEAMMSPVFDAPPSKQELIEIRELGLKGHSPITYHALIGVNHTSLGSLCMLAKVMLTQIWCAHPANRHRYMVLDPYDWDNIPEPLITTELFTVKEVKKEEPVKPNRELLPWE